MSNRLSPPRPDRFPDEVRAQIVVLLQGERDGTLARVEHHERGGVVVELMPVVQIREQPEGCRGGRRQRGRQAARAERQVVDRDDELSGRTACIARRPQVRARDAGVHDRPRHVAARHVHELRCRIAAVPVQVSRSRAFDANTVASHQVAMGDVVAVEVERALVCGGQVKARRVATRQRLVTGIGGTGRGILGEVLREARVLREIPVGRNGPDTDQHQPRRNPYPACATRHDHRIAPGTFHAGRIVGRMSAA